MTFSRGLQTVGLEARSRLHLLMRL